MYFKENRLVNYQVTQSIFKIKFYEEVRKYIQIIEKV